MTENARQPVATPSLPELHRMLTNMLRVGTVSAVDYAKFQIRVQSGSITTDWIRWFEVRAAATTTWSPPELGEQVMLLSPCGDMTAAVALRGIHSHSVPPPTISANNHRCQFPDGGVINYNHATSQLTINIKGTSFVFAKSGITIDGGGVVSTHDQVAGGISQITHVHGGVAPGGSTTAEPQ